jgi:hypothetical protein
MQNACKLSGLLFSCPLEIYDTNYPLHSIWKLPIEERLALINELNSEEIFKIIEYHKVCLTKKEKIHLINSFFN